MSNEAAIVLAQTESTVAATEQDSTAAATEQESTDAGSTENATAEADAGTGENTDVGTAVEGSTETLSPETYADLQLPEGVQVDQVLLDGAIPLFEKYGISKEGAQEFATLLANNNQAIQQGQNEAFNQLKQGWQDQTKNDKEIGGDKFEQSVSDGRAALDKFGTPALKTLLDDFGLGNHPEMVRFMSKVGHLTKEDLPGGGSPTSTPEKDRVSILYPNDS